MLWLAGGEPAGAGLALEVGEGAVVSMPQTYQCEPPNALPTAPSDFSPPYEVILRGEAFE